MTHWTLLYCIKMSWWKNCTYLCIYPTKQFIELIMEVECTIQISFCTVQISLNSYITLAKQRSKKYWCHHICLSVIFSFDTILTVSTLFKSYHLLIYSYETSQSLHTFTYPIYISWKLMCGIYCSFCNFTYYDHNSNVLLSNPFW